MNKISKVQQYLNAQKSLQNLAAATARAKAAISQLTAKLEKMGVDPSDIESEIALVDEQVAKLQQKQQDEIAKLENRIAAAEAKGQHGNDAAPGRSGSTRKRKPAGS